MSISEFRPDQQQEPIFFSPCHKALGVFGGCRSGKTVSLLASATAFIYDVPVRFRDGSEHRVRLHDQIGLPVRVAMVGYDSYHCEMLYDMLFKVVLRGLRRRFIRKTDVVRVIEQPSSLCARTVVLTNGVIDFLSSKGWEGSLDEVYDMVCIDEHVRHPYVARALYETSGRFLWARYDGNFGLDMPLVRLSTLKNTHINQRFVLDWARGDYNRLHGIAPGDVVRTG